MNRVLIINGVGYEAGDIVAAYLLVAAAVWIGFMAQRAFWGDRPLGMDPAVRAARVAIVGFFVGLFWLPELVLICIVLGFMLLAASA